MEMKRRELWRFTSNIKIKYLSRIWIQHCHINNAFIVFLLAIRCQSFIQYHSNSFQNHVTFSCWILAFFKIYFFFGISMHNFMGCLAERTVFAQIRVGTQILEIEGEKTKEFCSEPFPTKHHFTELSTKCQLRMATFHPNDKVFWRLII